jgi:hypothetical protein
MGEAGDPKAVRPAKAAAVKDVLRKNSLRVICIIFSRISPTNSPVNKNDRQITKINITVFQKTSTVNCRDRIFRLSTFDRKFSYSQTPFETDVVIQYKLCYILRNSSRRTV